MLMNEGRLRAGQIIKYDLGLWRVDYVNNSRARIIPLAKRHVLLKDGREFEAERGGVNISPRSFVELIENLDRAADEMQLAEAEKEVAEARREIEEEARLAAELVEAEAELEEARREAVATVAVSKPGGWRSTALGAFREGTLAAEVQAYVVAHPGCSAAEVAMMVQGKGNTTACLTRYARSGIFALMA